MAHSSKLYDYLVSLGATVSLLEENERQKLDRQWLRVFCRQVKKQTGKWIHDGYRWHAYSFEFEKAKQGDAAMKCYKSLRPKKFLVFTDWGPEIGFMCEGIQPPDLTVLRNDYFVFPKSFLWTMCFTHEQPTFGPYFACTDWRAFEDKKKAWEEG